MLRTKRCRSPASIIYCCWNALQQSRTSTINAIIFSLTPLLTGRPILSRRDQSEQIGLGKMLACFATYPDRRRGDGFESTSERKMVYTTLQTGKTALI